MLNEIAIEAMKPHENWILTEVDRILKDYDLVHNPESSSHSDWRCHFCHHRLDLDPDFIEETTFCHEDIRYEIIRDSRNEVRTK